MKRTLETAASASEPLAFWEPSEVLVRYLREVDCRLYGLISSEQRDHLVNETAFWVERGMRDRLLAGDSPEIAAREAVQKHGDAAMVAEELIEEAYENGVDTPMLNFVGRANGMAGAIFAFANLLYLILLQVRIYLPSASPTRLPFSPAVVRSVFPEPLPFPELSWQFLLTVGYPLLVPFGLGWICGRVIPAHAARAVYRGMIPVLLSAFALGCLLLPNTEGLLYALVQLVWWLPVGCLTAHLSSWFVRRACRRQFGRAVAATHPDKT